MVDGEELVRSLASVKRGQSNLGIIRKMAEHKDDVAPVLMKALRDEKSRMAAWALGEIGVSAAVPELIKLFGDESEYLRDDAAKAVGKLGVDNEQFGIILGLLEKGNQDEAKSAAKCVGEIGNPLAVPALLRWIRDEDWGVKYHVSEALGKIGDVSAVPALIDALDDGNPGVRRYAAITLGDFRDVSAVPALIKAINDKDDMVRADAAKALGMIGDSSALPCLIAALEDKAGRVVEWSAWALGEIGDESAARPLAGFLYERGRDFDCFNRNMVAEALRKIGGNYAFSVLVDGIRYKNRGLPSISSVIKKIGKPAIPLLIEKLNDDIAASYAAEALIEFGSAAVPALIQSLGGQNKHSYRYSAQALGKIKDASAVPALIKALKEEPESRETVAWALGQIGDASAVLALVDVLKDADVGVRQNAVKALVEIAKKNPSYDWRLALPALCEALKDKHIYVREYTAEALEYIKDPSTIPFLVESLQDGYYRVRRNSFRALLGIVDSTDTIESLNEAEKDLKKGFALLRKKPLSRKDVTEAAIGTARVLKLASEAKNRLASKRDVLLDGRPKPPKRGTLYQTARRAYNG